ncbi:unnamed protein product, partial [marine sediment metagenome]
MSKLEKSNLEKKGYEMAIQESAFRLQGKVALVTGGSRGIGRAIALGLAEAGADVVLASRKMPDLEVVAHEIFEKGRRALPVSANIRHLAEIDNLVKEAVSEFGHVDILVNNAAANPVFGSMFDVDEKAWDIILGLNLKSYFFLSQAVSKVMRDKGGGHNVYAWPNPGVFSAYPLTSYVDSLASLISA